MSEQISNVLVCFRSLRFDFSGCELKTSGQGCLFSSSQNKCKSDTFSSDDSSVYTGSSMHIGLIDIGANLRAFIKFIKMFSYSSIGVEREKQFNGRTMKITLIINENTKVKIEIYVQIKVRLPFLQYLQQIVVLLQKQLHA
ncbi:Hypothetical_protein [Hexamita inflata]|uniref:Hypothetical_protein n=1 Tax=Hexamita inflata TaxID=28002 RepID=A0ABP1IT49_9EUKA